MTPDGYTTRGRRSGACGHVHPDEPSAQACLEAHRAEREAEGAQSDRRVIPWRRAGPKARAGAVRVEQVLVRLTPAEITALDTVRGALSRADWFRSQLPPLPSRSAGE